MRMSIRGLRSRSEEYGRAAWAARWLQNLTQDLRFALRALRKSPGFLTAVVLTLAIGIGLNVALFTVLNTLFWAPPRVHDPSRIVEVKFQTQDRFSEQCSYSQYLTLKESAARLGDVAAYVDSDARSPHGPWRAKLVSGNYLELLGAGMALGRNFSADEEKTRSPVIVLGYSAWQRIFAGDRAILGKTIPLAGLSDTANSFTVVGVTSDNFGGLDPVIPDFWAPLSLRPAAVHFPGSSARFRSILNRVMRSVSLIGRLAPGIPREQARSALEASARRLPEEDSPIVAAKVTSRERLYPPPTDEDLLKRYLPLLVAFGLLVLIACANVANLLLARSASRRREVAVRLSLGASRARVVRQMLTESAIFACAGAALSLLFARALVKWALQAGGARIFVEAAWAADLQLNVRLDLRVYLFTLLVSAVATVALGLAPALESTSFDLALAMKGSCLDIFGRQRSLRPRDRLVTLQVAACLVLLVGAGLLLRSVVKALTFDPGFNVKKLYQLRVNRQVPGADDTPLRSAFAERVRLLPFVKTISLSSMDTTGSIVTPGASPDQRIPILYSVVMPDFFAALQLPILRGRPFTEREVASESAVSIVSEATARALWPGQDPIGRLIETRGVVADASSNVPSFGGSGRCRPTLTRGALLQVVGVTRDLESVSLSDRGREVLPHIYLPGPPDPCAHSMLIRMAADGQSGVQTLRRELAALDPGAALDVYPAASWYLADLQKIEWLSSVTVVLGTLALLLACVGLYGVMSFAVTQRIQEIGVRMALGAGTKSLLWLVLSRGLRLALAGAIPGVGLATLLAHAIEPYLFRVSPYDPVTFTTVPALLVAVCLAAAYVPARRATRVDPMVALRQE